MRTDKLCQRFFFILDVLLLALTVYLIFFNIFVINFPARVIILSSVISVAGMIAYLVIFKTRLLTKIIMPVAVAAVTVACSMVAYSVPYWNSYTLKDYTGTVMSFNSEITAKQAKDDLSSAMAYLKKTHPMFLSDDENDKKILEEVQTRFDASVAELIKTEKMTVNGLRREMQYIINPMRDAHTCLYNFGNDKFLNGFEAMQNSGYEVIAVNGKSVDLIKNDAKPYYSYETEEWINIDFSSRASLDFYGFTAPFTFVWSDGDKTVTEEYGENDFISPEPEEENISLQAFRATSSVGYEINEQKSLATLTLTSCEYDDYYIDCVKSMFEKVKEKNIRNVAVDLRGNGGGNSLVATEFIKYLPVDEYMDISYDWRWNYICYHYDYSNVKNNKVKELTFNGNVFVLTDNGTFSSAKDFAMLIQDNGLGKIVGKSPANSTNGYGEVANFVLPNTGLSMQISTKKWYRCNPDNTDNFIIPDYECDNAYDRLLEIIG